MGVACTPSSTGLGGAAAAPAIEVQHVLKRFRPDAPPALDDLSITVPQGVIFGILGPNGAGKTTLLSILCGLLKPTAGSVRLAGHDTLTAEVKRMLGVVPQEPAIYPTLTGRENLEYFGRMQGLRGARLAERVNACLQIAEIGDQADRRVEHYSGGYKRRLNLVIGLIHEPRILILDEPTLAIDPHSRSLIHQRLRELHAAGVTILLTTHYLEEAESLCRNIAIIDQGRIAERTSLPRLLSRLHTETFVLNLKGRVTELPELGGFVLQAVDDCTIEVEMNRAHTINGLFEALSRNGIEVISLRNKQNRLERLFLELVDRHGPESET